MAVGRRAAHLVWYLDRKKGERSELPRYLSQSFNFPPLPESTIIRAPAWWFTLVSWIPEESDPSLEEFPCDPSYMSRSLCG